MGGIGKTTLVKDVFIKLSDQFDCRGFLADVRESSWQHKGIEHLQKQLLGSLGLGSGEITDVDDGIMRMRETPPRKKVLIVLDDVDHRKQIQNLAGDAMEEMKTEEALRLFSRHAFYKDSPPYDYLSLSEEAVASTQQLPLALEVIGSLLWEKSRKDWIDIIKRLKKLRDLGRKVITDENFQDVMSAADCGCPRMLQKCSSKMRTKKKSRSCVFAQAIAATADRFWLPYPCTRIPSPVVFATMFQKMDMNLRTDTPSRRKNFQTGNKLKALDLTGCKNLRKTPKFSRYRGLERLILAKCTNLVEIDPSIETSKIPKSIGMLVRLRCLSLIGCSGRKRLPESLADMKSLIKFDLLSLDIVELPRTIGGLAKLAYPSLEGCRELKKLP
ncbi:uncharacterized protein LOC116188802 [Punica granatum]|uniref:Uncharacterized protein LOC116188802 n=1 Tax=Punica granatum TaxID=22663 RepID=A0A6P8BY45_PUNGR|nr:uncharacterized protein LOC116188802 [Punica granatum]